MNESIIIILGSVVFAIMVGSLISLVFLYQKKHLMEKNQIQLLELSLQNRVIAAIIDTQEIERKRLAEDLHDEMGALIFALKLNNHNLLETIKNDELFSEKMASNEQLINDIADRVRQVSQNLLPPSLKKGHLENALSALCEFFTSNSSIKVVYKKEENHCDISINDQVLLYRVLNEWFTNVAKHAEAKNMTLEFFKRQNNYVFKVFDDGKGFDYDVSLKNSKGLGLMSMKGRLMKTNAQFEFKNNSPKGTIFEISYPIKLNR